MPYVIKLRTKDIENGYISDWDADWFHHFRIGGYKTIQWLEILIEDENIKQEILRSLKEIHVPGEIEGNVIRVYGYVKNKAVDCL